MPTILGVFFIVLGAAMLVRRYVWRGANAASDSERATWPMWGLLILGVLMTGGAAYVDQFLDRLVVFVRDIVANIKP